MLSSKSSRPKLQSQIKRLMGKTVVTLEPNRPEKIREKSRPMFGVSTKKDLDLQKQRESDHVDAESMKS